MGSQKKDEQWIRECYEAIKEEEKESYAFVSIKIKQFRLLANKYGRVETNKLMDKLLHVIAQWAGDGGSTAHLYLGCYNVLLPVGGKPSKEKLLCRFDELEDCLAAAFNAQYPEGIHCGYGVYLLTSRDDFFMAQYKADVCRSMSPDQNQWVSHLELYGITFFEEKIPVQISLQKALVNKELQMFLQPKVDLKSGKVAEAEALIRWLEPGKGYRPVSSFLPSIEAAGMTNFIDFFIFGEVCKTVETWIRKYNKKIKVSVNFSQRSFNYPFFLKEFTDIFETYECPKECVEFELLESIVMNQAERVEEVVREMQNYGFTCSLDDFGSGYSSYNVLANTDLSTIKIDRSLFQNENNEKEKLVLRHIIETAHALGMKTVAEGVETQGYVDFLRKLGCDYVQGFVFYKPMPAEEFETLFVAGETCVVFD